MTVPAPALLEAEVGNLLQMIRQGTPLTLPEQERLADYIDASRKWERLQHDLERIRKRLATVTEEASAEETKAAARREAWEKEHPIAYRRGIASAVSAGLWLLLAGVLAEGALIAGLLETLK